ncbi:MULTISPECIES: NUDIX domain-containing protein [unclassified Neisseria]|uniref:NUDIX domain-containing protein n=1 Tax=unclassified Neisseria TaxID=2623750 RepID=UPI002666AEA7|nr:MULTISPECIES: NUDIX domain-containing protein [unclassified Neisseria]MDO1510598.1 NUDIX domain-containing protein [Neisseria sp. MVDL19-042950]MDO1516278.1 NUDIX domain-containing protein [Neisseria sp. MVDL18-041461]MDO1564250.1 NUDIX domain-containing protein [Neisseria sp. MVDL20-010259]
MMDSSRPLVRVVAGVVLNEQGRYLLSSRPEGKPYAGYWEFAGGKVEAGETELQALKREFEEELGIQIRQARPWLTKIHDYEHARVHLRFFRVEAGDWSGEIQAREGQAWSWQRAGDFDVSPMLPANGPLLAALAVPTELQGRLKTGLYGENGMGGYRVVPFESAERQHGNVLIEETALVKRGKMPEADSVWVVISRPEQWPHVQDADVVVWRVQNPAAAEAVCSVLEDGVSVPLVVSAAPDAAGKYRNRWLALGAHTVLVNDETEWA